MITEQTLQTDEGRVKIRAVRVGAFSIHHTIGGFVPRHSMPAVPPKLNTWTLTHAASGFAIRQDLCCQTSAEALAASLADFDWDIVAPKKGDPLPAKLEAARKTVREWPMTCDKCEWGANGR